jgi:hypothetical protein
MPNAYLGDAAMAEPNDRPAPALSSGVQPTPAPSAVRHPAPPPPFAREGELPGYRPLATAAVVGFGVAVLYAGFLIVCGLAAWFTGMPLPLNAWLLLVPLGGLIVSAVGWLQIQRSEGTLAGGKLAAWGIGLTLLAGLSHGMYLAGTYIAVGQQAETFAKDWLEDIRQHRLDEAFRKTVAPDERPRNDKGVKLHRELELRFNTGPDGSFRGDFTTFTNSDIVRLINHGRTAEAGDDVTIRSLGIRSSTAHGGGYKVEMSFEIRSSQRNVEMVVTAQATEHKEKGLQWMVDRTATGAQRGMELPPGARVRELNDSALQFSGDWVKKLGAGQAVEAYLETLPPGRRSQLVLEHGVVRAADALAPTAPLARAQILALPEAVRRQCLPGYGDFREGKLVHAGPDLFWAEEPLRSEISAVAREWFQRPTEVFVPRIRQEKASMPLWDRKGDTIRFYSGFEGNVFERYIVQGAFVAETDARALEESGAPEWHLAAIELYNGRSMSEMPPRR